MRRALVVAATAEPDEAEVLPRALPSTGAAWADLEWAETAGILMLERGIRFRHPLPRSTIYHAASAAERRAAHQALAEALATWGAPERISWHRALAQASPDEDVATALAEAGADARLRNAPAAAARALERAADQSGLAGSWRPPTTSSSLAEHGGGSCSWIERWRMPTIRSFASKSNSCGDARSP